MQIILNQKELNQAIIEYLVGSKLTTKEGDYTISFKAGRKNNGATAFIEYTENPTEQELIQKYDKDIPDYFDKEESLDEVVHAEEVEEVEESEEPVSSLFQE